MNFRQPFRGDYRISQRFGEIIEGVTKDNKPHTGIDYACPEGTPILASAEGTVLFAGLDKTGYGNLIIIRHDSDHTTLYAHLSSMSVKALQKVEQGEQIGCSGSTGYVTGPHLHFEARKVSWDIGTAFDPIDLPLQTIDDSIKPESSSQLPAASDQLEGICQVVCDAAFVRGWENLNREKLVYKGERVYVFPETKTSEGVTFYYIGGGSCMADRDAFGTVILEKNNG